MSETSPTVMSLAKAIAAAQGEIVGALKDVENSFFKSKYADLAAVIEAKREPFHKNGLAVVQTTEPMDGGILLVTTILHSSGEWIRGKFPVFLADLKPQAVGSAISYGRRYSLAAACGIAQIDDDAEAAHGRATHQTPPPPLDGKVKQVLEEASKESREALKLAWKGLHEEERKIVTSHHNKWWADLKNASP